MANDNGIDETNLGVAWGQAFNEFLLSTASEGSVVAAVALRAGELAGRAVEVADGIFRTTRELAQPVTDVVEADVLALRGARCFVGLIAGRYSS